MGFLDFVSIVGFWLSVTAKGVCEKGEKLQFNLCCYITDLSEDVPVKVNPNISVSIAYEQIILIIIRVIYLLLPLICGVLSYYLSACNTCNTIQMGSPHKTLSSRISCKTAFTFTFHSLKVMVVNPWGVVLPPE